MKKLGKNKFLDDLEGVFETKILRFIWAKCHIKINHAIYICYDQVREILKTVLNMRREIQFLRVARVYNGPDVRTGYRPVIACFSVRSRQTTHLETNIFFLGA